MKELLFWSLLLLCVQPFKARAAIIALLLIAHVDMSGTAFESATRIGWENTLKATLLPLWLLVVGWKVANRAGEPPPRLLLQRLLSSPLMWVWLLLTAYAAAAILWSPYALAGAKLASALISHSVVFLLLALFWWSDRLNPRGILLVQLLVLGIGAVHVYLAGNVYGTGEGQLYSRFTTFVGPQSFAQSFVALGFILIWYPRFSAPVRLLSVALLLGGAFASGSRIGFLGAVAGLAIWLARYLDAKRLIIVAGFLLAGLAALQSSAVSDRLASSRIGEAVSVLESGFEGIQNVGTFRWRAAYYGCLWEDQVAKGPVAAIVGSGTSSLARSALSCEANFRPASFSPNRVAHSEFLRALYEWGVVGLLLFSILVAGLLVASVRCWLIARQGADEEAWRFGATASVLPLFLLEISFENFIQGPLSPGVLGLLVVLAQATAARLKAARPAGSEAAPVERAWRSPEKEANV